MKANNRKALQKVYGRLYSRIDDGTSLAECAYCGSDRQCLDHVPPLSWVDCLDLDKFKKKGGRLLLYPSCNDCNTFLGNRQLLTYNERILYLYNRYMKEIDKRSKLWSEDEILELGYSLQLMVRSRVKRTNELIKKLRGIESRVIDLI